MLPELYYNQKVFIEITNTEHGGEGWGLGTCLWSPVYDRAHSKRWSLMEKIHQGDLILHLVYIHASYHWYGISVANSSLIQTENNPPKARDWVSMRPYQRINLTNFIRLDTPKPISEFFNQYDTRLRQIRNKYKQWQFYNIYGEKKDLRIAERYAAQCPNELYEVFDEYSSAIGFNPIFGANENTPTAHEPQNPDFAAPGRIETIVSRIVRDTQLARDTKKDNNWKCQICGESILLPNSNLYAEGHHLKPLGGNDQGPDVLENIIILCPTHHAEFDYGSIAINPESYTIEHIDSNNRFHNAKIAYSRGDLGHEFILYHYKNRFRRV